MSRIDGYGSGNAINPADTREIQKLNETKAKSADQITTDADAAAYLKTGAKPPLPEFAGPEKRAARLVEKRLWG